MFFFDFQLKTIYWPFMNLPHFLRVDFPLCLQHSFAWNPLPFYSLLSAFGNSNITTSLFQQPDNYLFDFSSIHSLSCSFGMDFLLPNWTTGNDLSFSISLYKLTLDMLSTSAAWLTESITDISSKFFTPCFHLISPQQKIPLYNTEKKLGFVDVFWEKFINYFHAKRGSPQIAGQTSFYTCKWSLFKLIYTKNKTVMLKLYGEFICKSG